MALTEDDLRRFMDKGYVVIPDAVPEAALRAALSAINRSLGQGVPAEEVSRYSARSWTPDLAESEAITDLLFAPSCWSLVEELVGEDRAEQPSSGQIALRFPGHDEDGTPEPHIDGRPLGWNGVDEYRNFTLLVGVFLKDVVEPWSGNLMVWPGTHRLYEEYFRTHGTDVMRQGGMPEAELPEPEHVLAGAGSVVLSHYQLGHAVAPHRGPDIRYAVYFRIRAVGHAERTFDCLTDIWLEYGGLKTRLAMA